jgi:hypothetical protein
MRVASAAAIFVGESKFVMSGFRRSTLNFLEFPRVSSKPGAALRLHNLTEAVSLKGNAHEGTDNPYGLAEWVSGVNLHGSNSKPHMSALGQKQTSAHVRAMSALPQIADIGSQARNVRFVPKADSCTAAKCGLFDHLVGSGE